MMPAMQPVAELGAIVALPDSLPCGSANTGKAGAKSGRSGQCAQPAAANTPSCRTFVAAGSIPRTCVSVSMAAHDWKVTPRRIRFLLATGRLEGLQGANGYWMVSYPYRFTFGARGAGLKRFQGQSQSPRGAV